MNDTSLRDTQRDATSVDGALALVGTGCAVCRTREADFEASGRDFEHDTVPGEFQFVRCRHCEHLYLDPRPSIRDIARIYPPDYYAYSTGSNPIAARLRRMREVQKVNLYRRAIGTGARRILEIGCGNGRFLSLLREYGPRDWELEGVDFSEGAIRQCQALGLRAYVRRIEDLTSKDGTYDAVIMMHLIEHLEDPRRSCEQVRALLRPGGVFILETPNVAGLDYRLFRGRWWAHYHFPRHWNLFSSASLRRLLGETGFAVVQTNSLINTSSWIISLHNFFLDRGYPDWLVRFFHFQNPALLPPFILIDFLRLRLGLETSDQRVIACRNP